jgi:hypothetical protein
VRINAAAAATAGVPPRDQNRREITVTLFRKPIGWAGAAAVLLVLTVAISPVRQAVASAGSNISSVFVTNDAAHAVPVAPQGTVNIAGSVGVTNTSTNPVAVTDVNDAQQPVILQGSINFSVGASESDDLVYTVPAGKRFVLETISMSASLPTGENIGADVDGELGLANPVHWQIIPTNEGVFSGDNIFAAFQQGRIYFEPGEQIYTEVGRSATTGAGGGSISISGYLVKAG